MLTKAPGQYLLFTAWWDLSNIWASQVQCAALWLCSFGAVSCNTSFRLQWCWGSSCDALVSWNSIPLKVRKINLRSMLNSALKTFPFVLGYCACSKPDCVCCMHCIDWSDACNQSVLRPRTVHVSISFFTTLLYNHTTVSCILEELEGYKVLENWCLHVSPSAEPWSQT